MVRAAAFAHLYLLDKIRAIAAANRHRDQEPAAQKILGLVQNLFAAPVWLGLYAPRGRALALVLSRGDDAEMFPAAFAPDAEIPTPPRAEPVRASRRRGVVDLRATAVRGGKTAALLRVQTAATERDPARERILAEAAEALADLAAAIVPARLPLPVTRSRPA